MIRLDLLEHILDSEAYPWEPSAAEASDYFLKMEADWASHASDEEEAAIAAHGTAFFAQLEQAWNTAPVAAPETIVNPALQAGLLEQLSGRIPEQLIDSILQKAQAVISTNLSVADQLVQCVQAILPGWSADDLQVLARPYAFAMRSGEPATLEVALRSVRYAAWTELSGIERARLSLAIARYTLSQMESAKRA
ncbi:MAG: hypothetical protein VKK04_07900 [Synechococcales bacterium]|nr:hypothetical protein [Synechococcales bacterium]